MVEAMTTVEIILTILNILLVSGGLVTVVTLRSTIKTARANAQVADTNANDQLMRSYKEHVLNPVLQEIEMLRKEREEWNREKEMSRENYQKMNKLYEKTNRKLDRLSRAVEKIPSCPHAAQCPVSDSLQKSAADCAD